MDGFVKHIEEYWSMHVILLYTIHPSAGFYSKQQIVYIYSLKRVETTSIESGKTQYSA